MTPDGSARARGAQEDAQEYLEETKLKELVAKYSEFINFPIYIYGSKEVDKEVPVDEEEEAPEDDEADADKDKDASEDDVEDAGLSTVQVHPNPSAPCALPPVIDMVWKHPHLGVAECWTQQACRACQDVMTQWWPEHCWLGERSIASCISTLGQANLFSAIRCASARLIERHAPIHAAC